MIKINSIKINGVTRNIENIAYLLSLPTANAESPDFVSVDGVLYAKAYIDSTYTYKNLAQSLTAGDNISISEDGVISVTGELGTQIEANPELTGDEIKLSSIAIDGVNYDIPEGAKAYVEDEEILVIDEGDIQAIDTSYVDQEIAELKEYVDQEVIALQEYVNGKISVTVNDDDTIDVTIN